MKKTFLMLGLLMVMQLFGCSKPQAAPEPENAISEASAPSVRSEAPENELMGEVDNQGAKIDAAAWVDANNAFGFSLLASVKGTTVVSPYSVERCLGMVLDGARGETASEMRKALSLPDAGNLSQVGGEIEKNMLASRSDAMALNIDNHLWLQKDYVLLDDYKSRVKAAYDAEPTLVDFMADPVGARAQINQSVANSTNQKITEILPDGSVDGLTRLVLTNAIYFKAPWVEAFKVEKTNKQDFKGEAGTKSVDMMHQTVKHGYIETDAYQAFDMDFKESTYAFMVILPKIAEGATGSSALADVEQMMNAQALRAARNDMFETKLELSMPKFRIEADTPLASIMQQLGMVKAFGNADFTGISGKTDLHINQIYHKAYIEVTEEGAEAAAATAAVMKLRMAPRPEPIIEVTVDHPFLYAIVEKSTGTALFVGRATDIDG